MVFSMVVAQDIRLFSVCARGGGGGGEKGGGGVDPGALRAPQHDIPPFTYNPPSISVLLSHAELC